MDVRTRCKAWLRVGWPSCAWSIIGSRRQLPSNPASAGMIRRSLHLSHLSDRTLHHEPMISRQLHHEKRRITLVDDIGARLIGTKRWLAVSTNLWMWVRQGGKHTLWTSLQTLTLVDSNYSPSGRCSKSKAFCLARVSTWKGALEGLTFFKKPDLKEFEQILGASVFILTMIVARASPLQSLPWWQAMPSLIWFNIYVRWSNCVC